MAVDESKAPEPDFILRVSTTELAALERISKSEVKLIKDAKGRIKTQFYISFAHSVPVVGESAMKDLESHPKCVVYDIFKFIGLPMEEIEVNPEWSFKLEPAERTGVNVIYHDDKNMKCQMQSTHILALFIKAMKKRAEDHLHREVKNVKLLIFSKVTNAQKYAVKHAAQMVGLECV